MLTNFHTHSTFCDGKNTPEEIVRYAIDRGFDAIGFSGHGYTPFDLRYCMKDIPAYQNEVRRLKTIYGGKIEIYLGLEEDAHNPLNRAEYDYIIGSSHYMHIGDGYYPVDSSYEHFKICLEKFDGDAIRLADAYYRSFCDYIVARKPDVVGHFDYVTKFDEMDVNRYLGHADYIKLVEHYLDIAMGSGSLFEVNTGGIARSFRSFPYPDRHLLYKLCKNDVGVVLSSDSHEVSTLDFDFENARAILKDIGFTHVYALKDGRWQKDYL